MGLLARLDAYGTDDPDFNEGHPEDRCPVCDWPTIDHVIGGVQLPADYCQQVWQSAKWPHRWHALLSILLNRK